MAGSLSVDRVVTDAELLINAWKSHPTFTLGTIERSDMEDDVSEIRADTAQIESLRSQLTLLLEKRDQKTKRLSDKNTRVRSGFRAHFGPDSAEYKQAGGTPTSERKTPKRKPKPTENASS
jgi:hypothetical protein